MNRSFLPLKWSDSEDSKNVFNVPCRRNWVDSWPFNRVDVRVQQPERALKYRFATRHVNTCDLRVTHTNQKWSDVIMSLMSTILSVNNITEKLWAHFSTRSVNFECFLIDKRDGLCSKLSANLETAQILKGTIDTELEITYFLGLCVLVNIKRNMNHKSFNGFTDMCDGIHQRQSLLSGLTCFSFNKSLIRQNQSNHNLESSMFVQLICVNINFLTSHHLKMKRIVI